MNSEHRSGTLLKALRAAYRQGQAESIAELGGRPLLIRRLLGSSRAEAEKMYSHVHGVSSPRRGAPQKPNLDLLKSREHRLHLRFIRQLRNLMEESGLAALPALMEAYKAYLHHFDRPLIEFEQVASMYGVSIQPSLGKEELKVSPYSQRVALNRFYAAELAKLGGKPVLMRELLNIKSSECVSIWRDIHGDAGTHGPLKWTLPELTKATRVSATYFARVAWHLYDKCEFSRIEALLNAYKLMRDRVDGPSMLGIDEAWLILKCLIHGEIGNDRLGLVACRHCQVVTLINLAEITGCVNCGQALSLRTVPAQSNQRSRVA